jgi:hypothetical protein
LTVKEPFRVVLDRKNGKTILDVIGLGGSFVAAEEDEEDDDKGGDKDDTEEQESKVTERELKEDNEADTVEVAEDVMEEAAPVRLV